MPAIIVRTGGFLPLSSTSDSRFSPAALSWESVLENFTANNFLNCLSSLQAKTPIPLIRPFEILLRGVRWKAALWSLQVALAWIPLENSLAQRAVIAMPDILCICKLTAQLLRLPPTENEAWRSPCLMRCSLLLSGFLLLATLNRTNRYPSRSLNPPSEPHHLDSTKLLRPYMNLRMTRRFVEQPNTYNCP